jgi:hypothetical protein
MVAKVNGKNQTLQYSDKVALQYDELEKSSQSEDATGEAAKIGKEYMKNDPQKSASPTPPDNATAMDVPKDDSAETPVDGADDHSDCPYCTEDNSELGDDNCPYCEEDSQDENTDNCPYCAEAHSESDHSHGDDCPHCQELDNSQAQESDPQTQAVDESVNPESDVKPPMEEDETGDNNAFVDPNAADPASSPADPMAPNIPPELETDEHKSPEDVMNEFDQVHGDPSEQDDSNYDQIGDVGIAEAGDGQEENISRPDDFGGEIPQGSEDPKNTMESDDSQEGEGSQEPNYSQVMGQDLANSQDDIQKERVGDIVRQSLQAFKMSKDYLEQAKQQSPEFYQANIGMIRAMIEMAKLLGFSGPAQQDASQGQPELGSEEAGMLAEQPQADAPNPADPFPAHPENGGDPAQGDSQDAKGGSGFSDPFPQHPDHSGGAGKKPKAQ